MNIIIESNLTSIMSLILKELDNFGGCKKMLVKECMQKLSKKLPQSLKTKEYNKAGKYPIIDQGKSYIAGYTDDAERVDFDLPLIIFGDHTRAIKFVDQEFALGADGVKLIRAKEGIDEKFLYYALFSIDLASRGYGRHFKLLNESEIIVPQDLVLQQKIVSYIDSLISDSIENKVYFNEQIESVVRSYVENLGKIDKLQSNPIFSKSLLKSLRQSILSDAIAGKLVPQDPNDEPASVLLSRIQAEKAQLIADKKIKKPKPLAPITEDEKPFELPIGWEWVRLNEISKNIHYGYTASAESIDTGVKMLRITDIQNNHVNRSTVPYCSISDIDLGKMKLEENDILIARTGGTVGKSFLIKNVSDVAVFASYLIRVILSKSVLHEYVKIFLESPSYRKQITAGITGSAQPNVNAVTLGNLVIPLPPLAEQHRIVAKVEQLMSLCDQLETQISDTQSQGKLLMEAVMQQAMG